MTRWLSKFVLRNSFRFVLPVLLSLLATISAIGLLSMSGSLISKAAMHPSSILLLYVPIVAVRTFGISRSAARYLERLTSHDATFRVLSQMRTLLYRRLEPHVMHIFRRYRSGDVLGLLASDIEKLQEWYLRLAIPFITAAIMAVCIIYISIRTDLHLGIIAGVGSLLMVVLAPCLNLGLRGVFHKKHAQLTKHSYASTTDAILGMGDWLCSGQTSTLFQSFERHESGRKQVLINNAQWKNGLTLFQDGAMLLIVLLVFLRASNLVHAQVIDRTLLAAIVFFVFPAMEAFQSLPRASEDVITYNACATRIKQAGEWESNQTAPRQMCGEEVIWPIHVHADNVSFTYGKHDAHSIFRISLDLPPGKHLAIVGRSGAGKSTLIHLLAGLLEPTSGTLFFNHANSTQVRQDVREALFAVVEQDAYLFHTTVLGNLLVANPNASIDMVREACRIAQIDEYLSSLPDGYNTLVSENGARFSGGERQRIALARAVLKNAPILLFDEPTTGLDPLVQLQFFKSMRNASTGKTVVWVTHQLHGVEAMDEILVMERGEVYLQGSHRELMKTSEYYRRLYMLDTPGAREA